MADDLDKPNPTQKALSQARIQEAMAQNQATMQQRQRAPGAIQSGSFEEQQVRQQAAQDLQQAQFNSNYQRASTGQRSSSPDQFAAQREAALKSGSFDYSAVRSASYTPPSNFVNNQGQRVTRTPVPQPEPAQPKIQTIQNKSPIMTGGGPPVIQLSQSSLERTNALRASQGLPPIEKVASIQLVKGTQSQPTTKTIKEPDIRTQYEKALATLSNQNKGGEAVSFLRFPFSANKGASSGGIESTTIIDPLQFLIGGAVGAAKTGVSLLTGLIKGESKTIVKEGSKDIGLNIKSSKEFLDAQRFTEQTRLLPKPDSVKPVSKPIVKPKPSGPIFNEQQINLGKGPAQIISKGGNSGGLTTKAPPKPPETPNNKDTDVYFQSKFSFAERKANEQGKTLVPIKTSSGMKLVTIVKQKQEPIIKPVSKIKVDYVKLGEGKGKLVQIQKPKLVPPKTIQKTSQEVITIPKLKQKQILEPIIRQKQKQGIVIPVPPKTKQTFEQPQKIRSRAPAILIPPKLKQRQTQTTILLNPPITTTTTLIPPGLTPPSNPPPITRTPPKPPRNPTPTEEPPKKPTPYAGLLGTKSGALGRVSKSGNRLGYIGNVPLSSIVGIYNRSEAIYGSPKANKIARKDYSQEQKLSNNTHKSLLGGNKNIRI